MLKFVIIVELCLNCVHVAAMAGRSLLDPSLDSTHRAAKLEESPGSLSSLVTRVANANWQIHPGWVDR